LTDTSDLRLRDVARGLHIFMDYKKARQSKIVAKIRKCKTKPILALYNNGLQDPNCQSNSSMRTVECGYERTNATFSE